MPNITEYRTKFLGPKGTLADPDLYAGAHDRMFRVALIEGIALVIETGQAIAEALRARPIP